MPELHNISDALSIHAQQRPDAVALALCAGRTPDGRRRYDTLTYGELERRTLHFARGLLRYGLRPGMRTVLMVPPGRDFFPLTFGLLRAGIVPVLVDPGLGRAQLGRCLSEARPEAFIGIPLAHMARLLLGWGRETVRHCVTVGPPALFGGANHALIASLGEDESIPLPHVQPDDTAAILFTSGSTGPAKGVVYRHRHFTAQAQLLRDMYGIAPGEVDLPTFPLFALFDPALGMTTVLPEMDFTRPARVDPTMLAELAADWQVTNMFGSPAVLATIARHARSQTLAFPSVRRVLSAGAPVPVATLQAVEALLPLQARLHTPYGATECLPVASIDHRELAETREATLRGAGVCVGRVVTPNDVRIIAIDDGPLDDWSQVRELPVGDIGEVTVLGPTTTDSYFGRPEADRKAKVQRDGRTVHRMGDTGWLDEQGRLWFGGRKSQRVVTPDRVLHTACVEEIFNAHPSVRRTALVGVRRSGRITPVICIERQPETAMRDEQIVSELSTLAAAHATTRGIDTFLFHPGFPVDIRHNAKIGREKLAAWAQERLS